jgi:hypothetical protein
VEFFLLQKVHLGWADSLDLPKHVLLAYFSHFEYLLGKFLRSTQVNFGLTDFRHELILIVDIMFLDECMEDFF